MKAGRRRLDDRGASAVEFAILALPFLLVIFLLIQAGLWFYGRQVALDAAREGVSQLRLAQTPQACSDQGPLVQTHVEEFARNVGSDALVNPQMDSPQCQANTVSVTVRGHAVSLIPFLTLNVTQVANGQVEKFEAP
jgi:Flp pilus assembly protein TadG